MKILICGDSWTAGYGVNPDQAWPNLLGKEFNNTSTWGASNQCIRDHFLKNYNDLQTI
jgi:lysophospholipase L1-like esterase